MKASLSGENKYLDRLLSDSHFRLLMTAAFGGGWNLVYALYHLVIAAVFRSWWFLTMGIYYLAVCGMRFNALHPGNLAQDAERERRSLRRNGLLTLGLAAVFSGIVCLTIAEQRNTVYGTVPAVTIAAYTVYCVANAVRNLAGLKKDRTAQKIMLRNCSMVYALGSLFGTERMMLGTFGNAEDHFTLVMEAASGAGFFLIIVLFGINLLALSAGRRGRT